MRYFTFVGSSRTIYYYGTKGQDAEFTLRGEAIVHGVRMHAQQPAFAFDVIASQLGTKQLVGDEASRSLAIVVRPRSEVECDRWLHIVEQGELAAHASCQPKLCSTSQPELVDEWACSFG